MREPLVYIIILNWNGKEHLKDCLPSVATTNYPNFKTVVVDNGSTDGSQEFVKRYFQNIELLENGKNLGFAEGNNVGVRYALYQGADYIALLNNDTEVDQNWISELVKVAESDPNIGACATKMLMFYARTVINGVGNSMALFGGAWDRGLGEKDVGQYGNIEEVFGACAGGMMVKREVVEEVGLFDKKYFIYFEDIDWAWRIRLFGYNIVYVPSAIVYHKFGASTGDPHSVRRLYLAHRNKMRNILKNYGRKTLRKVLPKMISNDMKQVLFLHKGNIRKKWTLVFIWAYLWNLWHLFGTFKLRMKVQNGRKISDEEMMKWIASVGNPPAIIPDYQIHDKKSFIINNKNMELLIMNNNETNALGPGWANIEECTIGDDTFIFRHTGKDAYFYLRFSDKFNVSEYKFSLFAAGGPPNELNGNIRLNNIAIGVFTLKPGGFVSLDYPLTEDIFSVDKNVEGHIQLSSVWVPDDYFNDGDYRPLGIKVHKLGFVKK